MTVGTPDFSKGAAFIDGEYVPIGEARIPITDWGFLRSDATYDVVTVWNGAFFRIDAHLERFLRSCARWRLNPGRDAAGIVQVLTQCVRLSGLRASYVEMICTRGQPTWGSRDPRQADYWQALRSGQSLSGHNHTTLVGLTESGFGNHGKKVCTDVVTCESSRDVASSPNTANNSSDQLSSFAASSQFQVPANPAVNASLS